MSASSMTASERALLDTTKLRAKAYVYIYEELAKVIGDERAKEICSNVTYRLGTEIAKDFSAKVQSSTIGVEELGDVLTKAPEHVMPYDKRVAQRKPGYMQIEMHQCPLVETWREMGLDQKKIALMCDISHRIDCGIVESCGHKVSFSSFISRGADKCEMEIAAEKT